MPGSLKTLKSFFAVLAAALVLAGGAVCLASRDAAVPESALEILEPGRGVAVDASWLHGLLLDEIKARVKGEALKVEFRPREPEEDVVLGAQPASYRVVPAGRIASGRVSRVRVEFLSKAGKVMEGVWVSAEVRVLREVWVAGREIDSGSLLRAGDVEKRMLEAKQAPPGSLDDPRKVIGLKAKRSLVAGAILREDQFESAVLVKRGQRVKIVLETGALRITAPGQALEKGSAGQTVQVMNLSSKKIVLAKVANHDTVVVEL